MFSGIGCSPVNCQKPVDKDVISHENKVTGGQRGATMQSQLKRDLKAVN